MTLGTHLASGLTTLCRCWAVTRRDGQVFGFTDHDGDLSFDGITFKADTGLTASALQQVTGLAVDNTEAIGALSDASVSEADIASGRFDHADVTYWLVNWQDPSERDVQFAGSIGEMKRADGAFYAELRGVSEALNKPLGRVFQKPCQAVLGDVACGVDLSAAGWRYDQPVQTVLEARVFHFAALTGVAPRWFERGRLEVLSGDAAGAIGMIKNDTLLGDLRVIELWEELRVPVGAGASVRLEVGCDKRFETCRSRFANAANFRGFPHIPGEDWLMTYPAAGGANDGGSRFQ